MLQVTIHECKFYDTCDRSKNGRGCIGWFRDYICEIDVERSCKYACFPDILSCCDCKKPKCFPSTSKVKLANGKSVTMSEVKLGDQVQTG